MGGAQRLWSSSHLVLRRTARGRRRHPLDWVDDGGFLVAEPDRGRGLRICCDRFNLEETLERSRAIGLPAPERVAGFD